MKRPLSSVSLAAFLCAVAACAVAPEREILLGNGDQHLAGCQPGDSSCAKPCDDKSDPSCDESPCAPGDVNCQKSSSSGGAMDPCAPQDAVAVGGGSADCPLLVGFAWNGKSCVEIDCQCKGSDCKSLASSTELCKKLHAACLAPPPADADCAAIAAKLDKLLPAVRACNIAVASAKAQCDVAVPTWNACPVPANGASPELKGYYALYQEYANHCPQPLKPCPAPPPAMACLQDANVDSLAGVCGYVDASPKPPAKE